MSKQTDFINSIASGAKSGQTKYGILASLTIAQAIQESGWGGHAPGNNLFGIKANGWTGKTISISTKECDNGNYINIVASFRAYNSLADSVTDHASFIAGNARYKNIIGCMDFATACTNIKADGYATDPAYAQSLIGLIKQYNLSQYDAVPVVVAPPKPAPAPQSIFYTVVKGDNLTNIAAKYKTTVQKLVALNGIKNANAINIGQKIKIS